MKNICTIAIKGSDCGFAAIAKLVATRLLIAISKPQIRQGLWVVFDQGLSSVATFLTGVLVARSAGKAEYGLFVLGFTVISIFQLIQRSLISVPFTVHRPHIEQDKRHSYLGSSLVHQFAISFFSMIGFALTAWILRLTYGQNSIFLAVVAMAMVSVAMLFKDFIRCVLLADLHVKASVTMGLFINITTISALLITYSYGKLTVFSACIILASCSVIPASVIVLRIKRRWKIIVTELLGDFLKNWHFGRWTLGSVVANSLGIRAIPWIILIFCGREDVALIGAMMAIAGIITPLMTGIASYLTPKLANLLKTSGQCSVIKAGMSVSKFAVAAGIVYVLLMIAAGEKFIQLLYTLNYSGHGNVLVVISIAVALEAVNVPLKAILRVTHHPEIESYGSVCALVLVIASSVILIPLFGIMGGAVSMVIGKAVIVFFYLAGIAVVCQGTNSASIQKGETDVRKV